MKPTQIALACLLTMAATCACTQEQPVISLPAASAATAAPATVDAALLLNDVRTLAAPAFEGRRTLSAGNHQAGAFVAERMRAIGLQPFGAGYGQPFKVVANARSAGGEAINYVGFIRGSAQPERFIVVSAHYDHLGVKNGDLYAGADDNASGVAAMLAVAAYFKAHPPAHTIVFAAFDGEEIGLLGAKAFVAALPFPKTQLAMNLNFDMVSHNEHNEIFATGTLKHPELIPLVTQAAARHTVNVKLGHDVGKGEDNWTAASDHGAFGAAGVPYLYFGVEDHPDYHKPGDTFEHINQGFFVKAANLLVDVAATADRTLP